MKILIIGGTKVPEKTRRSLLGTVTVASLAALGFFTICTPATLGVRPDAIPQSRGIQPDAPPKTETQPDSELTEFEDAVQTLK